MNTLKSKVYFSVAIIAPFAIFDVFNSIETGKCILVEYISLYISSICFSIIFLTTLYEAKIAKNNQKIKEYTEAQNLVAAFVFFIIAIVSFLMVYYSFARFPQTGAMMLFGVFSIICLISVTSIVWACMKINMGMKLDEPRNDGAAGGVNLSNTGVRSPETGVKNLGSTSPPPSRTKNGGSTTEDSISP